MIKVVKKLKLERSMNAKRNIISGTILKLYQTLFPFLMRTAMIYWMGVQYLGLNSLFVSVLQVLNLAELGVGSAMVYSMYQPIINDDVKKICALENLYKIYYRWIGIIIGIIGVFLTPFVPYLIKGNVPRDTNIYVLYLLNLFATVLSYWLYAYKNSILSAYQRIDVISKVTMITNTIQYVSQLFIIYYLKNYYLYIIALIVSQVLNNILTAVYVSKMYPLYKPQGDVNIVEKRKINRRIKDLFTSKIGAVVVNSADTIVISSFLGLSMLAIYQNYFYIITSVIGFVDVLFQSVTAGIGNSILVESKEKNFEDLCVFTLIISWTSGVAACCMLTIFQPFMDIWIGKSLELELPAVICLCIYFYIYEINRLLNTYKDAGGIWHQDRYRPLVTALSNLVLNLIMVQFIGIYGIILSTVFSMLFVGMPWILNNLFTTLFEEKQKIKYIKNILFFSLITIIVATMNYMICSILNFGTIGTIVFRLIVSIIFPNLIFVIIYHRIPEFYKAVELADRMAKHRLNVMKLVNNENDCM